MTDYAYHVSGQGQQRHPPVESTADSCPSLQTTVVALLLGYATTHSSLTVNAL